MDDLANKRWFQAVCVVLLFVLLIASTFALFSFFRWLLETFQSSSSSVQTSLIAGGFAFVLALFAFWKERSRAIREAHREKKIEVYSKFSDMIFTMIKKVAIDGDGTDYLESDKFKQTMIDFKKDLLVYGSPNTIKAFVNFQENSGNASPKSTLDVVEKMFLAIRKDIGLSNWRLNRGDLHRLYVTDYDTMKDKS